MRMPKIHREVIVSRIAAEAAVKIAGALGPGWRDDKRKGDLGHALMAAERFWGDTAIVIFAEISRTVPIDPLPKVMEVLDGLAEEFRVGVDRAISEEVLGKGPPPFSGIVAAVGRSGSIAGIPGVATITDDLKGRGKATFWASRDPADIVVGASALRTTVFWDEIGVVGEPDADLRRAVEDYLAARAARMAPVSRERDAGNVTRSAALRFSEAEPEERREILTSTAEDLVQALAEGDRDAVMERLLRLGGIASAASRDPASIDGLFEQAPEASGP